MSQLTGRDGKDSRHGAGGRYKADFFEFVFCLTILRGGNPFIGSGIVCEEYIFPAIITIMKPFDPKWVLVEADGGGMRPGSLREKARNKMLKAMKHFKNDFLHPPQLAELGTPEEYR